MAFFQENELNKIAIKRMVFHLVGPQDDSLVKLQEVQPGKFSEFFLDRIRSVNFGLPYVFSDASSTRERLKRIQDDGKTFQIESEKLAEDFQRLHRRSAAAGALLIFLLDVAGKTVFALLKYDDETVLAYDVKEGQGGRKTVSLEALERTFVQNKDALQKAALIRLTDSGGELTVLDRRNQQKVALYFENFLDAIREFDDADLTAKIVDVARKIIRENQELVPPDVYREVTKRTFEAAKGGGKIDGEHQLEYLNSVVGRKLPDDDPLAALFKRGLHTSRIEGMPLTLTPDKVQGPVSVRYRTSKGIDIRVPIGVEDLIDTSGPNIVIRDRVDKKFDDTK